MTQHPQALSLRPSPIGLVLRSTEQRLRDNIWVVTCEGYLKLSPWTWFYWFVFGLVRHKSRLYLGFVVKS